MIFNIRHGPVNWQMSSEVSFRDCLMLIIQLYYTIIQLIILVSWPMAVEFGKCVERKSIEHYGWPTVS